MQNQSYPEILRVQMFFKVIDNKMLLPTRLISPTRIYYAAPWSALVRFCKHQQSAKSIFTKSDDVSPNSYASTRRTENPNLRLISNRSVYKNTHLYTQVTMLQAPRFSSQYLEQPSTAHRSLPFRLLILTFSPRLNLQIYTRPAHQIVRSYYDTSTDSYDD